MRTVGMQTDAPSTAEIKVSVGEMSTQTEDLQPPAEELQYWITRLTAAPMEPEVILFEHW